MREGGQGPRLFFLKFDHFNTKVELENNYDVLFYRVLKSTCSPSAGLRSPT